MANQELIEQIVSIATKNNEECKRHLKTHDTFRHLVVVSDDFLYAVIRQNGNEAGVMVMSGKDIAVKMDINNANRIADTFHAENGYGKINWQVMERKEYLRKLIEYNDEMINRTKEMCA